MNKCRGPLCPIQGKQQCTGTLASRNAINTIGRESLVSLSPLSMSALCAGFSPLCLHSLSGASEMMRC